MSGIRVTYSGLISFGINLSSVTTGLIFTLIVTRQLSQEEFGTWGLIGVLTGYMLIIEPIVSYWSVREVARGVDSGKTSLLSSGMFSFISIPFYFVIVFFFGNETNIDLGILFFAAILIPVRFLRHVLSSINLGHSPQITAYSLLVFELVKIAFALILIYYFELGLFGVITTVFIASLAGVIYSIVRTRHKLKGKFNVNYLKNWLKLFWIPTYPQISKVIFTSDIVVFIIIVGSVADVAYWIAGIIIAAMILHSTNISKAVYSKLLEGGEKSHFQENFIRVLYFVFPLCAMVIVFARPSLFALNPNFEVVFPIVTFLTFFYFLQTIGAVFTQPLLGIEKIDLDKNASFKDYLKSKLFVLPTLRMIQRGGYLASLAILLVVLNPSVENKLDLIYYWSILAFLTHIPYPIILYRTIKKEFNPKLNKFAIGKYFFASIISFSIPYLLMEKYLIYNQSIFVFLPNLIPYVILGVMLYLGITYIIDSKTKKLVSSVILELKKQSAKK